VEKTIPKGYSAPVFGPKKRTGQEMQALPAHEYSADERAERARGAGIALLVLGLLALAAASALLAWLAS
jgi:hypothetical protein